MEDMDPDIQLAIERSVSDLSWAKQSSGQVPLPCPSRLQGHAGSPLELEQVLRGMAEKEPGPAAAPANLLAPDVVQPCEEVRPRSPVASRRPCDALCRRTWTKSSSQRPKTSDCEGYFAPTLQVSFRPI